MPNYANQTVATIISLSSPHSLPALSFERGVERVYEQINTLWRQAYQQSRPGPLDDLLLVSISGGSSDTTVSADSSSLRSLAPGSHGLTVFTTGIPGVWTPIDHLAILWCNQLAAVLARALLEIAEPRSPSQAGPVARRLEILKAHLRLGHGLPPFFDRAGSPARSKFHIPASHPEHADRVLHRPYQALRLTGPADGFFGPGDSGLRTHIIPLPPRPDMHPYEFTLLSSLVANDRLNVVACKGSSEAAILLLDDACQPLSASHAELLPRSEPDPAPAAAPGPDDRPGPALVYTFLHLPASQLSEADFLAIQVLPPSPRTSEPGGADFLVSEFRNLSASSLAAPPASFLGFNLLGIAVDLLPSQPSLVSHVQLSSLVSSLVAYELVFDAGADGCGSGGLFAPMMRQETGRTGEATFHPNVRTATLSTHFSEAYTPGRKSHEEEAGVRLTFWTDPLVCGGPRAGRMRLRIRMDVYGSVRRVVVRYRAGFVALPLGWLGLLLARHLDGRSSETVGGALSQLLKGWLGKLMVLVGLVQLAQAAALRMFFSSSTDGSGGEFGLVGPPRILADLLLGVRQPSLVVLAWLLVLVSLGWLALGYVLLDGLLRAAGALWTMLLARSSRPGGRPRKHSGSYSPPAGSSTPIAWPSLCFLGALAAFTVLYAPYHFAFILLTVLQLLTTLQCAAPSSGGEDGGRYGFNLAVLLVMVWLLPVSMPSVLAWLRSLQEGCYAPFADGRNVLCVAGFMGLVYLNRLGLRPAWPRAWLCAGVFRGVGLFGVCYGVRWPVTLFELFNAACLVLCLCWLM
ncbi:hypothetical protein PtB15_3B634 [Puccinia triticina]|nr:hypothetical protein PtB15_3B634 [Puccinia triticina]